MQLHTLHTSEKGPVILWGMYEFRERELLNTYETIKRLTGDCDYTLLAFEVTDWNREFSPWKSKEVDASFEGEASHTLAVLRNEYLPQIREQYGQEREIYLLGYSLAGLFALWAMCETDAFVGAGSCSGSLWYPQFVPYLAEHLNGVSGKRIYISLGGKEANTKDQLMSTIADRTRETVELLKQCCEVKYELNPGGHFADSGKRLAKAVRFLAGGERDKTGYF